MCVYRGDKQLLGAHYAIAGDHGDGVEDGVGYPDKGVEAESRPAEESCLISACHAGRRDHAAVGNTRYDIRPRKRNTHS